MLTLMTPAYGEIDIPYRLPDLDSFLRWRQSEGVPEKLKAHFYRGKVWVDLHMEELFSHNQVKAAIDLGLGGLIANDELGMYVPDGMMLRNDAADLATGPDAMFVSNESLAAKRVRFTAGRKRGAVATILVGTPDLVVEVVSPSSEDSDVDWLMPAYHNAGVPEYWVIDARSEVIRFDIFTRKPRAYRATRKTDSWVKSHTLNRSFLLTRRIGKHGLPLYKLDVR